MCVDCIQGWGDLRDLVGIQGQPQNQQNIGFQSDRRADHQNRDTVPNHALWEEPYQEGAESQRAIDYRHFAANVRNMYAEALPWLIQVN